MLSDEQAPIRSAVMFDILSTLDLLQTTFEATVGQNHDAGDLDEADDVDDTDDSDDDGATVVEKWNLKFTGDSNTLSVHNFLERVSELSTARDVSESQLFEKAIDLFSGKALNWFRANKGRFNDWPSLSILLRRHFEPPDYRSRLFKEILDRTQDTSESIVEYMSSMQGLFRRHGGLSPEAQLDILVRNLSPFYATHLPVVTTLEELELECLKIETKKHRVETYIPPFRRRQQLVEPDFAFVQMENTPSPPLSLQRPSRHTSEEVNSVQPYFNNSTAAKLRCWNCQRIGHLSKDCPNPWRMHCYRCGIPNVTVRTCTKCSGNESWRNKRSVLVPVDLISTDVPSEFTSAKGTDKWYASMINRIKQSPRNFPLWRVENGVLYKFLKRSFSGLSSPSDRWKIVVPKGNRKELLRRCHVIPALGHAGVSKTHRGVCRRYYWPKMKADTANYVRSCLDCARHKVEQKRPAGLMGERPEISQPFEAISLDYVGPLPRSKKGNRYILVISDDFSKSVFLFPHRAAKAKSLVETVESFFLLFGTPRYLTCDNGVQMKSKEFQSLCDRYKTRIFYTANYNPRANPTERHNRVIKTMLRTYVNQDNHRTWDEHLGEIGCAIRTSLSETTGFTPYFVLFGREYKLFGYEHSDKLPDPDVSMNSYIKSRQEGFRKLYDRVKTKIKVSRERNAHTYNLRRRPLTFNPGDRVWRKDKSLSDALNYYSAKLAPQYVGPFVIKRKCGSWSYELQDDHGNSKGIWHVQDLKPVSGPFVLDTDEDAEQENQQLSLVTSRTNLSNPYHQFYFP